MSSLLAKLQADAINAMREKNSEKADILKLLVSSVKSEEISLGKDISDTRVFQIIRSNIKAMEEAAKQYTSIGSKDLAQRELNQIEILSSYLPAGLSEDEIAKVVEKAISENSVSSMQGFASIMKAVMSEIGDRVEGSKVQAIVKEKLSA